MSGRYTARGLNSLLKSSTISRGTILAPRVVQMRIKLSIERLDSFPFSGRITDRPGVRVLTIVRYPYRIFYRAYGTGEVVILRILHAARDPSRS